ncbi:MAG: hypothetical protein AB1607_11620 [Chloroflexota bacterium]
MCRTKGRFVVPPAFTPSAFGRVGVLACAVTGARVPLTVEQIVNLSHACEGKGEVDFSVWLVVSHKPTTL